jgi:hypothetical protein
LETYLFQIEKRDKAATQKDLPTLHIHPEISFPADRLASFAELFELSNPSSASYRGDTEGEFR